MILTSIYIDYIKTLTNPALDLNISFKISRPRPIVWPWPYVDLDHHHELDLNLDLTLIVHSVEDLYFRFREGRPDVVDQHIHIVRWPRYLICFQTKMFKILGLCHRETSLKSLCSMSFMYLNISLSINFKKNFINTFYFWLKIFCLQTSSLVCSCWKK